MQNFNKTDPIVLEISAGNNFVLRDFRINRETNCRRFHCKHQKKIFVGLHGNHINIHNEGKRKIRKYIGIPNNVTLNSRVSPYRRTTDLSSKHSSRYSRHLRDDREMRYSISVYLTMNRSGH